SHIFRKVRIYELSLNEKNYQDHSSTHLSKDSTHQHHPYYGVYVINLSAGSSERTRNLVIVTGAASGIGASTCRTLRDSGYHPLVTDSDADGAHQIAQEIDSPSARLDV